MKPLEFEAELWLWDARRADTWTFLSVPPTLSEEIYDHATARPPACVRSKSSWARMRPPVRALISRARAATSVRVRPSARNLRNATERSLGT